MKKLLIFVGVVLFLLLVASCLLPVLFSLPSWARIACMAYRLALNTAMVVFWIIVIVKRIKHNSK